MSTSKMSAPTPSNLNTVLLRRLKNGCDFGSGGGASGIGRDCLSEIASATRIGDERNIYAAFVGSSLTHAKNIFISCRGPSNTGSDKISF
jgi:hypothetical protein